MTLLARNRSVRSDQRKVGGSVCVNVEPTVPILFIVAAGASRPQLSLVRIRMAALTPLHQRVRKIVGMTIFTPHPFMLAPQRKARLLMRKLHLAPAGGDVATTAPSRSRGAPASPRSQNGQSTGAAL